MASLNTALFYSSCHPYPILPLVENQWEPTSTQISPHNSERAKKNWQILQNKMLGTQGILKNYRAGDCHLQTSYFIEKVSTEHLYPKVRGCFGWTYLVEKFQSSEASSFDTWAQKHNYSSITYLDEATRQPYQVTVQDKKLVYKNGHPIPSGSVIFVWGKDDQLYVAKKRHGQFQHSSFFSGAPVLAAGTLNIGKDGSILAMSNYSGHYAPTEEQLERFRHKLQCDGMAIVSAELPCNPNEIIWV